MTLSQVRNGSCEEHHDNCSKIGSTVREFVNIWELYPSHQRSCNKFHTVDSNCNCALGAVTARPASHFNDKSVTCLSKTSREGYFVSAPAGFTSPWTLNIRKSPRRRPSWNHSCPTARCLTRPIPPALSQIPTAAAESACGVVLKPRSWPTLWIPSASVVPLTIPHSSASAERHSLLRRAPVFDWTQAPHCGTSRGALPSGQTPREIRVHKHIQIRLRLPWELEHQAGRDTRRSALMSSAQLFVSGRSSAR